MYHIFRHTPCTRHSLNLRGVLSRAMLWPWDMDLHCLVTRTSCVPYTTRFPATSNLTSVGQKPFFRFGGYTSMLPARCLCCIVFVAYVLMFCLKLHNMDRRYMSPSKLLVASRSEVRHSDWDRPLPKNPEAPCHCQWRKCPGAERLLFGFKAKRCCS